MNTCTLLSATLAATALLALAPVQAQAPSISTSQLEAKVQALQSQVNALQAQVQQLQAQLRTAPPVPKNRAQSFNAPNFTVPNFTVPSFAPPAPHSSNIPPCRIILLKAAR